MSNGLRLRPVAPPLAAPSSARGGQFSTLLSRDISFGNRGKPTAKQREALYLELGMLLGAGVDIKTALDLQVDQHKGALRTTLEELRSAVVSGSTVAAALEASGHFSAYEFHSVRIGEETGRLADILHELARYYTRQIKQRRQLLQALAYPALVLSTAAGAVLFMLRFIVPMFADVFRRFGGELPPLTQAIVRLSAGVREHGLLGVALVFGLVLLGRWLANVPTYRYLLSRFMLRIPILGPLLRGVYLGRLCGSLALLTGAHVPLLQALALARQMLSFAPLARALQEVEARVLLGAPLHSSLQEFGFLFDARLVALVKVGEEVNKLDYFFNLLAQQYGEEVDHRAALLSTALEPLIMLFLGGVVGLILIGMYLPIFQISNAIQ
ncbi:type II secretion system F family protein [Hymenobacter segetis]|uniref:General secretion pathway protein F n=1 Tax=Hymenobacter segetis TaxID=2025509 RepID=A0ABU9LUE5_9BACT